MRWIRAIRMAGAAAGAAAALALAGCGEQERGPIRVVAIGPAPALANPNTAPLSPAASMLLDSVAQGLVQFNATGEIEPGLAQSWIVSNDGRRYTFRLRPALWARGTPVTARQVVERLQAAISQASRNPLKPVLGAIVEVEAMTDRVLEIRLLAPRPHLLQLLAQPEMAILMNNEGTGPYRIGGPAGEAMRLVPPQPEDPEDETDRAAEIHLSGAPAALAIARFERGEADLVTGGTVAEVPLLEVAGLPEDQIVFDPVSGLFGLTFASVQGPLGNPQLRRALAMAIDRQGLVGRLDVPELRAQVTIAPAGLDDLPNPAPPDWAETPLPTRRELASQMVAEVLQGEPLRLRVAIPEGLGYRIAFAHLRRDWRAIGVEAVAVPARAQAELRLIDEVAPAPIGAWYLRHFTCRTTAFCSAAADKMIELGRNAGTMEERQAAFVQAHRLLSEAGAFVPLATPVRWSLRNPRLNGFRPNPFARHATDLIRTGN